MANETDGVVRRRVKKIEDKPSRPVKVDEKSERASSSLGTETEYAENKVESGTYWLTRIVFLRSLAFVYCKH